MNDSEWQPIETAPRDGTLIIVYQDAQSVDFDDGKGPLITTASWNGDDFESPRHMVFLPTHWIRIPTTFRSDKSLTPREIVNARYFELAKLVEEDEIGIAAAWGQMKRCILAQGFKPESNLQVALAVLFPSVNPAEHI